MKEQRSEAIAELLSNNVRWCSHSRGLDMTVLKSEEIRLKIDDYRQGQKLNTCIHEYYDVFADFINQKTLAKAKAKIEESGLKQKLETIKKLSQKTGDSSYSIRPPFEGRTDFRNRVFGKPKK